MLQQVVKSVIETKFPSSDEDSLAPDEQMKNELKSDFHWFPSSDEDSLAPDKAMCQLDGEFIEVSVL